MILVGGNVDSGLLVLRKRVHIDLFKTQALQVAREKTQSLQCATPLVCSPFPPACVSKSNSSTSWISARSKTILLVYFFFLLEKMTRSDPKVHQYQKKKVAILECSPEVEMVL
jgi:hypothetical protein